MANNGNIRIGELYVSSGNGLYAIPTLVKDNIVSFIETTNIGSTDINEYSQNITGYPIANFKKTFKVDEKGGWGSYKEAAPFFSQKTAKNDKTGCQHRLQAINNQTEGRMSYVSYEFQKLHDAFVTYMAKHYNSQELMGDYPKGKIRQNRLILEKSFKIIMKIAPILKKLKNRTQKTYWMYFHTPENYRYENYKMIKERWVASLVLILALERYLKTAEKYVSDKGSK